MSKQQLSLIKVLLLNEKLYQDMVINLMQSKHRFRGVANHGFSKIGTIKPQLKFATLSKLCNPSLELIYWEKKGSMFSVFIKTYHAGKGLSSG